MSAPFTEAGTIPVNDPTAVISYSAVVLKVPGRPADLELKVTIPVSGDDLPVILLSHGHGATNFLASLHGYGPLADFWAAHGYAVIQPTHLDSTALGLRDTDLPDAPIFWRDRATDMHAVLDHLEEIEATIPGLRGRLDRERIAVAGHSLGGGTVSLLLGMQVLDPDDDRDKDLSDPRIKAGVIIAAPGIGDEHLSPWAAENYPMMKYIDFATMAGPALVIAGDADLNLNFSDRLSYRWAAAPVGGSPRCCAPSSPPDATTPSRPRRPGPSPPPCWWSRESTATTPARRCSTTDCRTVTPRSSAIGKDRCCPKFFPSVYAWRAACSSAGLPRPDRCNGGR